jgi:uncharacterized protein YndB with AHSA1/START domain
MDDRHETTVDLDDPPAAVWDALTDPPGVEAWLGEGSTLVPVEGTPIDVADTETGTRRHGKVDEVEPERRLVFTWWPADGDSVDSRSTVTIHLTPNGFGTRLVVTEQRLAAQAAWRWRIASVELCLIAAHMPVGASRC